MIDKALVDVVDALDKLDLEEGFSKFVRKTDLRALYFAAMKLSTCVFDCLSELIERISVRKIGGVSKMLTAVNVQSFESEDFSRATTG
jgi:hypothetical protein